MTALLDKLILFICCTLLLYVQIPGTGLFHVLAILTAIIFTSFCGCCNPSCLFWHGLSRQNRTSLSALWLLFAGISLCISETGFFLPLLFYEITIAFPLPIPKTAFESRPFLGNTSRDIPEISPKTAFESRPALGDASRDIPEISPKTAFESKPSFGDAPKNSHHKLCQKQLGHQPKRSLIFYSAACLLPFLSLRDAPDFCFRIVILLFLLVWILAMKTSRLHGMEENLRLLRDSTTEYHLLLQQKNKDLIEKQNHEIHIATLKERNRIAREIHDNVGHMLSRSILQAGAVTAVNQQENLQEPLNALTMTLSSAMTSVRESVHNLHDDSIDLKGALLELFSGFSQDYRIRLDYDMGHYVPASVKYCFISIVKEALSNISRHSNGSEISITLREHPSLYQLIIKDNGTNIMQNHSGMGIANMQERIRQLNGTFSLSAKEGFQIFAAVPRENH